jgi:acyl carrier protein
MMPDKDLESRFYDLLASCLPEGSILPLAPEMTLRRDLGLDSVKLVMLLFKFEEEFGVELPDAALAKGPMTSVGELFQEAMKALQGGAES